jgi:hypothetical protein
MINIEHNNELEWDYQGWRKVSDMPYAYTQKDWNQTLATKLNQASVEIHKYSFRGGADTIRVNQKMYNLISTLEYFDSATSKIAGRYKVVVDNLLFNDEIYIFFDKGLSEFGYSYANALIPKTEKKEGVEYTTVEIDGRLETTLAELTLSFSHDEEANKEHYKNLVWKINVLNYA